MPELEFAPAILNRPGMLGRSAMDRLFLKRVIDAETGCWLWQGKIKAGGYGVTSVFSRQALAHRVAYMGLVGPIPSGMQLDHLCRVPACFNPEHLEPVTAQVNRIRAIPFITPPVFTHCKRGHERTTETVYVDRDGNPHCRVCRRESATRFNDRRREKRRAAKRASA